MGDIKTSKKAFWKLYNSSADVLRIRTRQASLFNTLILNHNMSETSCYFKTKLMKIDINSDFGISYLFSVI
jgi:hypothetical protein